MQPSRDEAMRIIAEKLWPRDKWYPKYQRCGYCNRDRRCRLIYRSYICKECDDQLAEGGC